MSDNRPRINIGRFTIIEHPLKTGGITIMLNEKCVAAGEGGTFDEEALEKVINKFYLDSF